MGRTPIINKKELARLLKKGIPQKDIAIIYGVTDASISEAKKELKIATGRSITLEAGHEAAKQNFDAVEQLQKINTVTNKLLDELTGEDHIVDNMIKAVKAVVEFESNPTKDNSKYLKTMITMINSEKNTAIKACSEIRGQLSLQLEIFKTLYDMEAMAEFKDVVVDAIGEVAPKVRTKIIAKLKRKKALRESVSFRQLRSDH